MTESIRYSTTATPVHRSGVSRRAPAIALAVILAGCALTHSELVQLPARNSIHSEQLVVLSDFRIPGNSPLIADLKALRESVHTTLELPYGSRPVTVYLFANELTYSQYLKTTFPDLPERRAYFVKKTPGDELAVYTAWGGPRAGGPAARVHARPAPRGDEDAPPVAR